MVRMMNSVESKKNEYKMLYVLRRYAKTVKLNRIWWFVTMRLPPVNIGGVGFSLQSWNGRLKPSEGVRLTGVYEVIHQGNRI